MDDGGTGGAVQGAGRQIHVGGGNRIDQRVDADLACRQRVGIGLDAHGEFGAAEDADLRHAFQRGDLPRQQGLGIFVHRGRLQRVRAHGEEQDRQVRRVHFAEGRLLRQRLGQIVARGADRRLHVLGGAVQAAVQAELQIDAGRALGAGRGHLVDALDGGELVLQGRCDRGRHGVGVRARQARHHRDGGKVHIGQVGDRQVGIAIGAEDHHGRHHQRGHDGTFDKRQRQIHFLSLEALSPALSAACLPLWWPPPPAPACFLVPADADLGAGQHAQLAVGDHQIARFQVAGNRVIDAVIEQQASPGAVRPRRPSPHRRTGRRARYSPHRAAPAWRAGSRTATTVVSTSWPGTSAMSVLA